MRVRVLEVIVDSLTGTSTGTVVSAVVLLAGGLLLPPLARAAGRSVLDLSIAPDESVLDQWLRLVPADSSIPVRAVHGPQIPAPMLEDAQRPRVEVIRERDAYRGPAGAIRDVTGDLQPQDWVLVIEATRFHSGPIDPILRAVSGDDSDIFVACNSDRTPAGVYAMRRSVLDHVASVGYVDLKEQLLARARAAGDRVRVVEHTDNLSFPLRTRPELLRAASLTGGERRSAHAHANASQILTGERWDSIVASNTAIDPSAVIIESVVMPGARIGQDAVVARSIICPNAIVPAGSVVLDQTIGMNNGPRANLHHPDAERGRSFTNARMSIARFGWRASRQQGTAT